MRGNGLKLCQQRFTFDVTIFFFLGKSFNALNRLPREIVKLLSLEVFKKHGAWHFTE